MPAAFHSETNVSYYRARYYDSQAGRFISEDPIGFGGDGPNKYVYARNQPTMFVDPLGLLAEVYCERIPSAGATWWQNIGLTLSQAMHCFLRVACNGKDETFEIGHPFVNGKATPHANTYNPKRPGRRFPVYAPPGMKCCEFEQRLRDAFQRESGMLPTYNAWGPNSNTFVHQIIFDAGGYADFPVGAYGVNDGLR
jgi:RHS repeat-associated protein